MSLKAYCSKKGIDVHVYVAWVNMRQRCRNPNKPQWKDWGGRGITICPSWDVFSVFATDMGLHPGKGWTLDRKDNNLGYSKNNCRWATRVEQNRNTRIIQVTPAIAAYIRQNYIHGIGVGQLAKRLGLKRTTVQNIGAGRNWAL